MMQSADEIIETLALAPHPEGGYFRETFRDAHGADGRAASTAIYYLLKAGQRSHWHRVDAAEIWHFYAGAPLVLSIKTDTGSLGAPARHRSSGWRGAAGDRARAYVAERRVRRRLEPRRLHCRTGIRIRRI